MWQRQKIAKCLEKGRHFEKWFKGFDRCILKNCSKVLTNVNEGGNAARGDTGDPPADTPGETAPRAARRLGDGRGRRRGPPPRLGAEQQLSQAGLHQDRQGLLRRA